VTAIAQQEANPPAIREDQVSADVLNTKALIHKLDVLETELAESLTAQREQAEAVRQMRKKLEAQEKEIQKLEANQSHFPPAILESSSEPAGPDAAALRSAVKALKADDAAKPGQVLPPPPELVGSYRGELYFRIGDVTLIPNGWMDFTGYFRSTNVGSGLGTNFQSIPYNNTVQGGQSEFRLTAQASRIGLRVDEIVGPLKAYGYVEADFNGYLPSNAYVSTNSDTLRMRVYYLNVAHDKWEVLAGQGWSLITPTRKALSPFLADLFNTFHLDTSYQAGLIYARQPQLRFVYHPTESTALGLSIEEPEQYSGSAVTFPTLFSSTETDAGSSSGGGTSTPNIHPDVIAKATIDRYVHGLYWHAGVAGLLTPTRVYTPSSITKADSVTDIREGGGAAVDFNLELLRGFHLIGVGYWSDGGGRYLGGMGPGFVVLQNGTISSPFQAALIHSGSGIGGFEWMLTRRTTISTYYSSAYFQRRYGLDPDIKTPTYVGYGYPGSSNTNNRTIREASFASITTLWQKSAYGALQFITQSSHVTRSPWYMAPNSPKDAHTFMEFMSLRYVLP
jgi:hypothetical protein